VAERKRANGFVLLDAAFAADRKFVRLARLAKDTTEYAACIGAFMLILADARRVRDPGVDWDEYSEYGEQIALLQEVKLLTSTGFDPATFDKWAPAYRSPWDKQWVRSGTERVRNPTDTSDQIISTHLSNGEGGVGETPPAFIRYKDPERGAGLWHGKGTHDGRHGEACMVCFPPKVPA
jgi:hypothetical protein